MAKIEKPAHPRLARMAARMKQFGGFAVRGLLITQAPAVMKGFLNVYLKEVTLVEIKERIEGNKSLWDEIDEHQGAAIAYFSKLGNLDWFTADWVIDAIKKEHPAMASLFLGWKKAHNWLGKQIELFKTKTEEKRQGEMQEEE